MNVTIGTTVYALWMRGHHVMLTAVARNGRRIPHTDRRTYRMMDDGRLVLSGRTGMGGGPVSASA